MSHQKLLSTVDAMTVKGKGILAADESSLTIAKRFETINLESSEETRRNYRELLFTTPNLEQFICGIILFEETLKQSTQDGISFPEYLSNRGIIPGIKVDKGLIPFECSGSEKITQGLDDLPARLKEYKALGARFAKWRVVYSISDTTPSRLVIKTNAQLLARYARMCQNEGILPIVEPEVLMDGTHSIETCFKITEAVHQAVFRSLYKHGIKLETIILKPSMVIAGKGNKTTSSFEEVAENTIKLFRRTVPAAVPTINFLSGGQTPEQATENLLAINSQGAQPWQLSFSYGRALQEPCLKSWLGKSENVKAAQEALLMRAKLNGAATK